jgi:hypothetical protein
MCQTRVLNVAFISRSPIIVDLIFFRPRLCPLHNYHQLRCNNDDGCQIREQGDQEEGSGLHVQCQGECFIRRAFRAIIDANASLTWQAATNLSDVEADEDKNAARVVEENRLKKDALLGYGKADLLKLSPVFGRWNKRVLMPTEVSKMVTSMEDKIERYAEEHLIDLILPPDAIVTTLATGPADGGDVLPLLQFREGVDQKAIPAAGGQHRLAALKIICQKLEARIESKANEIRKVSEKLEASPDDATLQREIETLTSEMTKLKKKLKGQSMWGFRIYDLGE